MALSHKKCHNPSGHFCTIQYNGYSCNADMLNHSFQPNCFLHWRFKDRMLEVMINAGQQIKKGDEVCPFVSSTIPFPLSSLLFLCSLPVLFVNIDR